MNFFNMKNIATRLLIACITLLCASCSEAYLKASTVKTKKVCHNPEVGQVVTVEMDYITYTGKLSQISKDEIIVSTDSQGITYVVIQSPQIKGIYC